MAEVSCESALRMAGLAGRGLLGAALLVLSVSNKQGWVEKEGGKEGQAGIAGRALLSAALLVPKVNEKG
eukprot:170379-Pelagomonas_calceolata.AAC.1